VTQRLKSPRLVLSTAQPSEVGGVKKKVGPQPRLGRLVKSRKVELEYLTHKAEHMANCWAGMKGGAFGPLETAVDFEKIDSLDEFAAAFMEAMAGVAYEALLAFVPKGGKGRRAVGLFLWSEKGREIWPQVVWFPWASTRDKLTAAAKFLDEARLSDKFVQFYVPATPQTTRYIEHLGQEVEVISKDLLLPKHLSHYGLLKYCGKVDGYYENGKAAVLYYTKPRWGSLR